MNLKRTEKLRRSLSRRGFLVGSVAVLGGAGLPMRSRAGEPKPGTGEIALKAAEPWAPHPKAAPLTERRGAAFAVLANGYFCDRITEMARRNVFVYPDGGVTVIDVRDVAAAHLAAAEPGNVAQSLH